jgi:hypothetical protein
VTDDKRAAEEQKDKERAPHPEELTDEQRLKREASAEDHQERSEHGKPPRGHL